MIAAILLAQVKLPEAVRLSVACAKAFREKDKGWIERHLAAGFVYKDLEGERLGREDTLEKIGKWFRPLGYRVGTSLTLVSARRTSTGMLLVSDLKVTSQLFGLRRMPLTETTVRVESSWRPSGADWAASRIIELSSKKTVDGKLVKD